MHAKAMDALIDALTVGDEKLLRENEKLRAALAPFAKIGLWRDTYPDAKGDFLTARQMQGYVKVEDVRAARAALGDQQSTQETK